MKNNKGFSLIEVLIVLSIAAVAGGLIFDFLASSGKLFIDQSAVINHGLSLNQSQQELSETIKSSSGIAAQYPAQGTAQYESDSNTLVVELPGIDENGDAVNTFNDYAVIEADQSNPKILRKQVFKDDQSYRKNESKVLSINLKNINFSYLDSSNGQTVPEVAVRVGYVISLSSDTGDSDKESSGSGTVNLKNL